MVMLKPIAYFVIGVFTGLTISGLMKQEKPVNRIAIHDNYRQRYNYPHRYYYDYYYRPVEYRGGGHGQSNTRNDEGRRGGGGRKDTERGETHTNVRQVQDKVKN